MKPTMSQVHIDTPLTRISIAYRNTNYIGGEVFPVVPVQNQSDEYFIFDKASWYRNEAGPRAPGTRGPEVEYSISSCGYACRPYSAAKLVPDEIVDNADAPLRPRIEATEFVTDKILLNMEYSVASTVFATNTWTGSPASAISPTWDDATSDPINDIEVGREDVVKRIGREPNLLVIGREVWTDLKRHPDLLERIKYSGRSKITLEILAELFEVERVLVGTAVYDSGDEGATASYSFIWGKNAALLWVPPSPGLMVPSAGYIFAWKNRVIKRFRREEEGTDVIRCESNYVAKVVSGDAGYYLPSCVA